jgi:myo-inositol-1(or 4)-monophosphatase
VNLEKICQQTAELARTVGGFIRTEGASFDRDKVEYKGVNNMVSYVDKEAEKKLVQQLSRIVPEAGFITEEGTNTNRSETLNWIIDPLDGTTNFIHGAPPFAVSVGLVEHGKVIVGVVYEVNADECFYAWKGGGAYCNGKRIQVSKAQTLADSLLVTGFPYLTEGKMETYIEILKSMLKNTHGIRRLGSAATDLAYVAMGRFEAFYEYNLSPWDVAGGILLVQEAGGQVSDFNGGDTQLFGGKIIASNGRIHQSLLDAINRYWQA